MNEGYAEIFKEFVGIFRSELDKIHGRLDELDRKLDRSLELLEPPSGEDSLDIAALLEDYGHGDEQLPERQPGDDPGSFEKTQGQEETKDYTQMLESTILNALLRGFEDKGLECSVEDAEAIAKSVADALWDLIEPIEDADAS